MPEETFIITKKDAQGLIQSYIDACINENLVPPIAGGTMKMDRISQMRGSLTAFKVALDRQEDNPVTLDRYRGFTAWSCWNTNANDFFLACELHPALALGIPNSQVPAHDILVRPVEIIKFEGQSANDFLHLVTDPAKWQEDETLDTGIDETDPNSALFKIKEFRDNGPKLDNEKLNDFGFSLFDTRRVPGEVDRFLDQETEHGMKYIRYFFGYDATKKENKIRVILVGVREDGSNIFPPEGKTVDELRKLIKAPIMLQNSWPPRGDD